ncbi:rRNA N(6)-adenosine-methyltransferase ZCCHC4 [Onthophagus taurus]|uniref:rRNA N(6)-adenosine-methyltransferase ZCCHC4 n=1 Tax=Onthophagus taurus TaxID=166361 RepID=UPI0039BE42AF
MSINVEKFNLNKSPQCPHGPTILFSRSTHEKRKFFACSACRDKKDCNFFLWQDEVDSLSESVRKSWEDERKSYIKGINRKKKVEMLNLMKKLPQHKRRYCLKCNRFILEKFLKKHNKHDLINISDELLSKPSYIFKPLDNNRKEAQYLFSPSTITMIINVLKDLNVKNVLCVGTPRIHEFILTGNLNKNSLLLDFDKRYHNFYDIDQFCWYNMFNHHFFLKSKRVFNEFIKNSFGNLILIVDPPFGGRIELLAKTFRRINKAFRNITNVQEDLKVLFIFPYFMEPQILNSLPEYKMLDYKIQYDNHVLFQHGVKGRKQGSPVRIFTNINPSLIQLPKDEGYKYCGKCNRWVSNENKHCNKCNSCTSKDGRTYIHCDKCERCVKPTWIHCKDCNKCALKDHYCGELPFQKQCFHCHKDGHKKRECPEVDHELLRKKRRK